MAENTEVLEVKEVPIDTLTSQAEYKKARAEGKTAIEQKVAPVVEESEEIESPKPDEVHAKSKGGFQSRIDRLIKQNAKLEEQLEQLRTKPNAKTEEEIQTPKAPAAPKRADFQTDDEYLDARIEWGVAERIRKQQEIEEREAEENHQKLIFKTYNERVSEAKSRYDDWEDKVNQEAEIPSGVGLAILRMENGPDVAYHIGSNPDLRAELLELDPLEAIGRAWEISRELKGKGKSKVEESDEESEEIEEQKPKKTETKIVPPIKPISGGITKSSIPIDKTSFADYKKRRAAGQTR